MTDFKTARYTAIISDLHLCETEPVHPRFPLWKKYKTKEFFFDTVFADFLAMLEKKAGGESVELILNGDIFDFDSVTRLPVEPPYKVGWLEACRGLAPHEEKSLYKIREIFTDHDVFVVALKDFLARGNRVVFIIGNHDLELHFPSVQKEILMRLAVEDDCVRFCEWFFISNGDTLIEHGNQYDPYCVCQDQINPFVRKGHRIELRVPFGNLATRYLINGMGYFNPHVDTNFIMSTKEYIVFFFKYMSRSQPLLIWTWFWGAVVTLFQTFFDRLLPSIRDPMMVEEISEEIARKSNATPGMVRQLRTLAVAPAANSPWLLAKELWLDRALILLFAAYLVGNVYFVVNEMVQMSPLWFAIPVVLFLPPFIFYAQVVGSNVVSFKEPQERILMNSSWITGVNRVVYGHTHITRHEVVGGVEHLNSGCWSPAFIDVECTKSVDQKTYVWISPCNRGDREAQLIAYEPEMAAVPSPMTRSASDGG